MTAVIINQPQRTNLSLASDNNWKWDRLAQYFDFEAAERAVHQHCMTLSSQRDDDGKLMLDKTGATLKAYSRDLKKFIAYLHNPMVEDEEQLEAAYQNALNGLAALPTANIVESYRSFLSRLSASTINRYLSPVRHFCEHLANQDMEFGSMPEADRWDVVNRQKAIAKAATIKGTKPQEINYLPPIQRPDGRKAGRQKTWLELDKVLKILKSIDRNTIMGKRDYALLLVGFNTLLRLAELHRLSLSCFAFADDDTLTITVRGKRNNYTPVPCPRHVYEAVCDYVNAYNARAASMGVSPIGDNDPLWRELDKGDHLPSETELAALRWSPRSPADETTFQRLTAQAATAICDWAIADRVKTISGAVGHQVSPHDMRRSGALIAYLSGMPMKQIQVMLRHKSIATTERYLGEFIDFKTATLTYYGCLVA